MKNGEHLALILRCLSPHLNERNPMKATKQDPRSGFICIVKHVFSVLLVNAVYSIRRLKELWGSQAEN